MSKNVGGDTFYLDFERIREVDGYVYYWYLNDFLKPSEYGDLSSKVYIQGDCKNFRLLRLSLSHHQEPMGGGSGDVGNSKNQDWDYPPPDSVSEVMLTIVCNR